jgi:hypothetical protein
MRAELLGCVQRVERFLVPSKRIHITQALLAMLSRYRLKEVLRCPMRWRAESAMYLSLAWRGCPRPYINICGMPCELKRLERGAAGHMRAVLMRSKCLETLSCTPEC